MVVLSFDYRFAKKWLHRLPKLSQSSASPGLYLALIPDYKSDIIPVSLLLSAGLQLWLADAVEQRPEPHPHEQLRLQLGDHRRLWGHRRDRPRSLFVLMAAHLVCSRSLPPSHSGSVTKEKVTRTFRPKGEGFRVRVNEKIFCFPNNIFAMIKTYSWCTLSTNIFLSPN